MKKRSQWELQNHLNLGGFNEHPGQGSKPRPRPMRDNLDTSMYVHSLLSVRDLIPMVPDSKEGFGDMEM